jgi:septal ring factor EnvC (AmiA/AmiB activator)
MKWKHDGAAQGVAVRACGAEARMTYEGIWITLIAGTFGTLIGSIATIIAAVISRQPTLAAVVDARIAALMEIYERTIGELRAEIERLEEKIDGYERTIRDLRDHISQLEAKIDIVKADLKKTGATPALQPDRLRTG